MTTTSLDLSQDVSELLNTLESYGELDALTAQLTAVADRLACVLPPESLDNEVLGALVCELLPDLGQ